MTKRGEVHGKGSLFMRVYVGEADNGKEKYVMSTNIHDNSPIIESKQSGKYFTLPWSDIVNIAVDAGIDTETLKTYNLPPRLS